MAWRPTSHVLPPGGLGDLGPTVTCSSSEQVTGRSQAERVHVLLVATKVDLHMVLVVPSLTDTCEPVVYLTALTDPARQ